MQGWTYDDVDDLPQPVYDELIAYLQDEARQRQREHARIRRR